jgi:hypothetical protein
MHTYFARYVRWYLENVERVSIYFSEWRHLTGERRRAVLEQRRHYNEFVEQLIEDVKAAGSATPDLDVKFATFFLLGAVNGLPTWYRRRGGSNPDEIASAYADLAVGTVCGTHPADALAAG